MSTNPPTNPPTTRDSTPPAGTPPTPSEELAESVQAVLPLDLDPDEPVPFRLTPKARRVVAPDAMPALEVVPPTAPTPQDGAADERHEVPVDLDDPHDPRSARARALRRGGMSVPAIAHRLDVDELAVRTWTGDLDLRGRRRPRLRAVPVATTRPHRDPAGDVTDQERLARHHAAFAAARREAADGAGTRMTDPTFVRGLALTVAAAEIDEHALLVAVRDRDVARTVRAWLVEHAGVEVRDLRVVVRLGSTTEADLVMHRWAESLGLPPERLARTLWRSAPTEDAVEVLLRVPDAAVAARVAGWRDAMLGPEDLGDLPRGVGF